MRSPRAVGGRRARFRRIATTAASPARPEEQDEGSGYGRDQRANDGGPDTSADGEISLHALGRASCLEQELAGLLDPEGSDRASSVPGEVVGRCAAVWADRDFRPLPTEVSETLNLG